MRGIVSRRPSPATPIETAASSFSAVRTPSSRWLGGVRLFIIRAPCAEYWLSGIATALRSIAPRWARGTTALSRRGPGRRRLPPPRHPDRPLIQCRGSASDRASTSDLATAGDHPYDLAFGHRRLSIVDLSRQDINRCPRWMDRSGSSSRDDPQLPRAPERAPGHWVIHSRAAPTPKSSSTPGPSGAPECVARFNGMWAFVIWDGPPASSLPLAIVSGSSPDLGDRRSGALLSPRNLKALRALPNIPLQPSTPSRCITTSR
jgi:hypothetical protein